MISRFQNILIPVDFSINTDVAIDKALELVEESPAILHLFHIQKIPKTGMLHYYHFVAGSSWHDRKMEQQEAQDRLDELRDRIESTKKNVRVFTSISYGVPEEEAIIQKARKLESNLIIIGKHSHHSWFPFLNTVVSSKLAAATGIAVLTVKPGSFNRPIKTIVTAVDSRFPKGKLEIIDALRKKFNVHIKLVTFLENNIDLNEAAANKDSLLNIYRLLKSNLTCPVDYEILSGPNKAKALLNYCDEISADVLIVHAETETKVGWLNTHLADIMPSSSQTQLLTVRNQN